MQCSKERFNPGEHTTGLASSVCKALPSNRLWGETTCQEWFITFQVKWPSSRFSLCVYSNLYSLLSKPWFSHLENENKSAYVTGVSGGVSEIMLDMRFYFRYGNMLENHCGPREDCTMVWMFMSPPKCTRWHLTPRWWYPKCGFGEDRVRRAEFSWMGWMPS